MENRQEKEKNILDSIDLLSMLKDIGRQWWVILLVAAAMSLLSNVYVNMKYRPEYTVHTTFAVSAKGMNNSIYQNLATTIDMADQMTVILDSNLLKRKVAEELGMKSLNAKTEVEAIAETNMLRFSVTSDSALNSFRILKSILENYNQVSDYVIRNVVLEEIQRPSIPTAVSNPMNPRGTMKKVFLAAAAVMILIFAALSYIKDTVKNEADMKDKIDAHFFGSIYHENKKRGVKKNKNLSMAIINPFLSFRFVEANKMLASKIRSRMEKRGAKVLLVTSVMENEGKSTVAANIALSLAQEHKRVMLLDFDFRKPAQYKIFGMSKDDTVDFPEILSTGTMSDSLIKKYDEFPLYLLLNSHATTSMETLLGSDMLKRLMNYFKERMDFIIVDTSPMALVSDTEEIAQLCDASALVIRQDFVHCREINDAVDTLNRTKAHVLGTVFNNVHTGILDQKLH